MVYMQIAKQLFFLCLTFIVTLVITYPTIVNINSSVIGDGGDNFQFLSYQYITKSNIAEFRHPFANSNIMRFPMGFDYSRSFDGMLGTVVGALLMFIVSPVAAYNLSILLLLFLNIHISYLSFKYISKNDLAAYAGALIYGSSFYVIGRSYGHSNLMFIAGLPMIVAGIYAIWKKQNTIYSFALLFGGILVLSIGSTQYVLYLLIGGALLGILTLFFFPDDVKKTLISILTHPRPFLVSFFVFLLVFVILYFPYLNSLFFSKSFVFPNSKYQLFDLKPALSDYFLPNAFLQLAIGRLLLSPAETKIEGAVFFGFIELLLFAFFVFSSYFDRKIRIFYLVCVSSIAILPFLIYPYVYSLFPFSTTAEIGRYYIFAQLCIALAIVLYLTHHKKNVAFILVITVLLFVERLSLHYPLAPVQPYTEIFHQIRQVNARSFVILPYDNWFSAYNLFPVFTDKKITSGYIHWSAETRDIKKNLAGCENPSRFDLNTITEPVTYFSNPQSLQKEESQNTYFLSCLRKKGIRLIVYDKFYRVYWDGRESMLARMAKLFPRYSTVRSAQNYTIEASRWIHDTLRYSLHFPKSGYFTLHKVHYGTPTKNTNLVIELNSQRTYENMNSTNSYEWGKWTTIVTSTDSAQLVVPAGSVLTFNTDEYYTEQGFLTFEYSFSEIDEAEPPVDMDPFMKKLYEDPQYELWYIN